MIVEVGQVWEDVSYPRQQATFVVLRPSGHLLSKWVLLRLNADRPYTTVSWSIGNECWKRIA